MATDPKVIAVAMAIKQSLEMNTGAGGSVNAHPNAFFLNVNGPVDMYKAAESALKRAASYDDATAAAFHRAVDEVFAKLQTEIKAGAVSIEDALARLKVKGGGELVAVEGAVEAAVARAAKEGVKPVKVSAPANAL